MRVEDSQKSLVQTQQDVQRASAEISGLAKKFDAALAEKRTNEIVLTMSLAELPTERRQLNAWTEFSYRFEQIPTLPEGNLSLTAWDVQQVSVSPPLSFTTSATIDSERVITLKIATPDAQRFEELVKTGAITAHLMIASDKL